MSNVDFLAIGDIATDAFIKLQIARVDCEDGSNECNLIMPFANKIPFEDSIIVPAVGNSANAAVAASRLGLKSALICGIGEDAYGKEDIEVLQKENVSTEYVKVNPGKKSNYHYVLLYQGERTILIKHEEYDYKMPEIAAPRWIYLSSLSKNTVPFHHEIAEYVRQHPETLLAYQPGTFQIELGFEGLKDIYAVTEIFFCNVEEAERIVGEKSSEPERRLQVKFLLEKMRSLGPKKIVITDGPKGAYSYDGKEFLFMPPYPDPATPLDRTGAGDSFSSTVVAALALDLPLKTAIEWGPVNSMSVVQYIGAREGLLKRADIEAYLAERPDYYKAERI